MQYPVISTERTGKRIKEMCESQGIRAKDIQEYMGFSTTQSVYDWFRGKNLPSLDNLYALSCLLKVPMETLVVAPGQAVSGNLKEYELSSLRCRDGSKILKMYLRRLFGYLQVAHT